MNPYSDILNCRKSAPTPAQEALRKSFLELCKGKHFSAVGVTELCSRAHVARTTFYSSYPNTDALLNEIEDDLIVDLLKVNDRREIDSENSKFAKNVLKFVRAHRETLHTLLLDQPDARLIEKWKKAVKFHFWEVLGGNEAANEFALEIIASISLGGYTYLLKNPTEFDLEEMVRMFNAATEIIQY